MLYFYVDIYLILNLILNFFLLGITGILRQKQVHLIRWFLAAAGAAVFSSVWVCVTLKAGRQWQVFALAVLPVMVWIAYREHSFRGWQRDLLMFILSGVAVGGSLLAVKEGFGRLFPAMFRGGMTGYCSVWFLLGGIAGLTLLFLLLRRELVYQMQCQKTTAEAKLIHQGKSHEIRVLYDSGNQLVSPYTGERVAVISEDLARELNLKNQQNPLWIPYRSIGGEGILQAYRLDCILLQDGRSRKCFLAAVSDRLCRQNEIQMILNITS